MTHYKRRRCSAFYLKRSEMSGKTGSALILTMIMLVLIIVFFSSFMILAVYNHQNAKIGESLVQARLHCQTGLHSFYRDLSVQWSQPTNENRYPSSKSGQTNYFTPATGDWADRFYWASTDTDTTDITDALHVELAGVDFTPNSTLNASVGWKHIYDPQGSGGVIARTAYLVIDESGKIDPGAVVEKGVDEGDEVREGTSPTDISLLPLFTTGFARKFQPVGTGTGTMPDTALWFSYFHILKGHPEAAANYTDVIKKTVFPHSYDIEAFNVYELSGGNTRPVTKHRFNLSSVDWEAVANDITYDSLTIGLDASDFWDGAAVETNKGGIPWLANATEEDIKNQVIANIVDYCDTDSIATTDDPEAPTFVGLEQVPYINELAFTAEIMWDAGLGKYVLYVTLFPELINCYPEDFSERGILEIQFQIEADDSIVGTEIDPRTIEFSLAETVEKRNYYPSPLATQRAGYDAEVAKHVQAIPLENPGVWDDFFQGSLSTLTGIKVTINHAKLTNISGELWDFAFTEPSAPIVTGDVSANAIKSISVEVDDPRANLKTEEWTWSNTWIVGSADTLGRANVACNPEGPSYDQESYSVPGAPTDLTPYPIALDTTELKGISTMYIRDEPMKSLWELGCIHRGTPWQTLNLATYSSGAISTSGLDEYAKGDANILDQVKLSAEVETSGRVNINTPYKEVVEALLTNIPLGGTYEDPDATGKVLTESAAEDIASSGSSPVLGEWLFHNGSTGGKSGTDVGGDPFENRGQLALINELINGVAYTPGDTTDDLHQNTDMWREEIIGKVANLCTTRSNFFTVVIVAQTIKDLPSSQGGTYGTYDDGIDKILAEQKTLVVLHRDGFDNQFRVLRLEYLE